jgi:methylthioribose-1-phosphate isomerase
MLVKTLEWVDNKLRLIDQTQLPERLVYLDLDDYLELAAAIKRLSVRGAPAIGVSAAYGVVLGVQGLAQADRATFDRTADTVIKTLAATRPTAVNLFWALKRMEQIVKTHEKLTPGELLPKLLAEARAIEQDDRETCGRIGTHGAVLVKSGAAILTHCNAGGLATTQYGTALAVIYQAQKEGKQVRVYADETRPLLQGARLTAWELTQAGIPVTVICDNMAAFLMQQKKIDLVIVGADRIAANGDTANKIGTYSVAVAARHHNVPFYVAAPVSTFDLNIPDGSAIPIEERAAEEIAISNGKRMVPAAAAVYNPAFDVTPAGLITAIITDQGLIERPSRETVAQKVKPA